MSRNFFSEATSQMWPCGVWNAHGQTDFDTEPCELMFFNCTIGN